MNILGGVMVPHPPLIIPEIGRGKELKISDTVNSYLEVCSKIRDYEPETIIIISPHSNSEIDSFNVYNGFGDSGDFSNFGASNVNFSVEYDVEFVSKMIEFGEEFNFPINVCESEELDHGIMVPLYFLNKEYKDYKVVRISLSGLSSCKHYEMGMLIQKVALELGRKYFVIASGDLSHKLREDGPYGFDESGPRYDEMIMKDMESSSFFNLLNYEESFLDSAAICGHKSFCIMAGIFDGFSVDGKKYSYEGPFGVGYGICSYDVLDYDEERYFLDKLNSQDKYVLLARRAIENYVRNGSTISLDEVDSELINNKAGVFVSINKDGNLRGCIGTISPIYSSIALEIIHNSISAATKDYRFEPISISELDSLEISVYVLSDAEDINSLDDLDPKRYGVIVSKDYRKGVLLPDLDGVDTVEEQISIALSKANILENEDYKIERFEVIKHW